MAKNNFAKGFFSFLNFISIFVGIFLPGSCRNEIWDKIFFFSLGLSQLELDRNNAGIMFLNFFAFFFFGIF